jgi:hypothetical protein
MKVATASIFFGHLLSEVKQAELSGKTAKDSKNWRDIDIVMHGNLSNPEMSVAVPGTLFEVTDEPDSLPIQYVNKEKLENFNAFTKDVLGLPKLKMSDPHWYMAASVRKVS